MTVLALSWWLQNMINSSQSCSVHSYKERQTCHFTKRSSANQNALSTCFGFGSGYRACVTAIEMRLCASLEHSNTLVFGLRLLIRVYSATNSHTTSTISIRIFRPRTTLTGFSQYQNIWDPL